MTTLRNRFACRAASACAALAIMGCELAESPAELGVYETNVRSGDAGRSSDAGDSRPRSPRVRDAHPPVRDAHPPVPSADAGTPAQAEDAGAAPDLQGMVSTEPLAYDDPALRCYVLTAHAAGDRDTPYLVPREPDHFVNFTFEAPWDQTQYVRSFSVILDDRRYIHHWELLQNAEPVAPGVAPSDRLHPGARLVYAWDPAANKMFFRSDVGMQVDARTTYTLEVHYNNTMDEPAPDASGVEICVTPEKPTHLVSLSQLGTEGDDRDPNEEQSLVTGTCTPQPSDEIRILALRPRMGLQGQRAEVVINQPSGVRPVPLEPFSFETETWQLQDVRLEPGETLTTTCIFSTPKRFGSDGVQSGHCDLYALHWPARALVNEPSLSASGIADTCLR